MKKGGEIKERDQRSRNVGIGGKAVNEGQSSHNDWNDNDDNHKA